MGWWLVLVVAIAVAALVGCGSSHTVRSSAKKRIAGVGNWRLLLKVAPVILQETKDSSVSIANRLEFGNTIESSSLLIAVSSSSSSFVCLLYLLLLFTDCLV